MDFGRQPLDGAERGGEIGGVGAEAAGARHALRAPGDMPLPADDAVDVGDHAEGEARQPVGLETLAEGDAWYREIGGAGARRQIVAEPPVGDLDRKSQRLNSSP